MSEIKDERKMKGPSLPPPASLQKGKKGRTVMLKIYMDTIDS